MTSNVITARPETPLEEIAILLERNSIKRVPIVKDGQLVGIVSRANLVQALASARRGPRDPAKPARRYHAHQPIMPPRIGSDIWPVELGPIMPGPRSWDAGRAAIGDVTIGAAKTTVDKVAVNGSLY
jgi:hypothetical protein